MDVNGTRFQLLLGCADWARCTADDGGSLGLICDPAGPPPDGMSPPTDPTVAWDSVRQELTLEPIPFAFVSARTDRPPRLSDRRGAGADTFGSFYWIDRSARAVLVQSSGAGASTFWPGPTAATPEPRSGAFSADCADAAPLRAHRSAVRRSPRTTSWCWAWSTRPACWCSICSRADRRHSCHGPPTSISRRLTWPRGRAAACSCSTARTAWRGSSTATSTSSPPPLSRRPPRRPGASWRKRHPRHHSRRRRATRSRWPMPRASAMMRSRSRPTPAAAS